MAEFFRLKTIAELHNAVGLEKPLHPMISIIREWPKPAIDLNGIKVISDLYLLGMKGNVKGTFKYGRNSYDYEEGSLVFVAPNQVVQFDEADADVDANGWNIFFHPDLIRKSELGKTIKDFTFFEYGLNEALHVSDKEKNMLSDFVMRIETELQQNIDKHSQELMLVNLESILKYCSRYYDRQFYTRTNMNKDFIVRFEQYLEQYFSSEELYDKGIPTVTDCGKALNMSGSYLSDLLKSETGSSAKDHIHSYIIEKAKTLLLNSKSPISEVSYGLGFEYSQHFSKLFKRKTGFTPSDYRNMN